MKSEVILIIPIIKADRELAVQIGALHPRGILARAIKRGAQDDLPLVQFLASHRLLGQHEGLRRAAEIARNWNGETSDGNTFFIADAIEAEIEGLK